MRKIRLPAAAVVSLGCIVLTGCSKPATSAATGGFSPKAEYRMQVTVGPTTPWGMGAQKFADLVKEKTGGAIIVKPYFGGQLLKGAQLNSAQMVATGAIDCALESTINTAPVIPELDIFSLPFTINTYEKLDCVEAGDTGKVLFRKMEEKGLKPLAWGENGFRQLTNGKRAIAKPEDLKGLKIRVVGSQLFTDTFRQLGADPVNMNWGDAVSAFQQGVVDGQENPCGILLSVQIWQYHAFCTLWNYVADPLILYWSKKDWDRFPPEVQQAILAAAEEATRFEKALARAGLDGGKSLALLKESFGFTPEISDPLKHLADKGVQLTTLSESQQALFREALQPMREKWAGKIGESVTAAVARDLSP